MAIGVLASLRVRVRVRVRVRARATGRDHGEGRALPKGANLARREPRLG